jgi:predicted kinase
MINRLLNNIPEEIINKLKNLPQDMKWHPEGLVINHILLVSRFLPEKVNLQLCAIFHDLGKIDTFKVTERIDKIKIQNIGHEIYAQQYIDSLKENFIEDNVDWDMVSYVCLNHMKMHKYNNGELKNPLKRKELEDNKYFEYLKIFADADAMMSKLDYQKVYPYLILTFGIPGSGKTTWAKAFVERSGYTRICPDDIREEVTGKISDISQDGKVWELAYKRVNDALEDRKHVIFDATNVNQKTIAKAYKLFGDKSTILFKIFNCDIDTAKSRIKKDLENKVNRSNVPDFIVERMYQMYINTIGTIEDRFIIKEI